jgi:CheY-like chemotaxis protein
LLAARDALKVCRLLIVDDAPTNRKIVRRLLRESFQVVEEAENGQDAVQLFLTAMEKQQKRRRELMDADPSLTPLDFVSPFPVVMMDYEMPIMNGLEATKLVKAMSPSTVIVGVTGNGLQSDIDLFMDAGADCVMIKPINIEEFLNFVAVHSQI